MMPYFIVCLVILCSLYVKDCRNNLKPSMKVYSSRKICVCFCQVLAGLLDWDYLKPNQRFALLFAIQDLTTLAANLPKN